MSRESKWKTACEIGIGHVGVGAVCTTGFSSFMDLGNRVSLGEKSLGIYIFFGLTGSQINLIIQQFN